jgi:glyoxylase-like metal-dependent hydrolase (beta-lactamase superfamily II)
VPARDGATIELGRVRLGFLETPGHTPEGISIVVYDLDRDPACPHAVLTGDTLFVGDVGRPDLMASVGVTAEELASQLYDSLHGKLLRLPDETLVYPAHGAGSMCGKNLGRETFSTIGEQRRYNYALQPMSRPTSCHRDRRPAGSASLLRVRRRLNRPPAADARFGARGSAQPLGPMPSSAPERRGSVLDVRDPG